MKIVVTGAAGYVGSALTDLLTRHGHHVVAVDNDERRLDVLKGFSLSAGSAEFHARDLEELANDPLLLAGADAVTHLAGVSADGPAERDPAWARKLNVDLALALATAAKRLGVSRFLVASTVAIYQVPVGHRLEHAEFHEHDHPPMGEPVGVYAQTKMAAEQALMALSDDHFAVIVLRKGSLYGYSPVMRWDLIINRMTLTAWMGRPLLLHDLGAVWRPIAHVQDAARAYLYLLGLPPWSTRSLVFNLVERNARLSEVGLEVDDVLRAETGRGIVFMHGASPLRQRTGRVSGEALRRLGWQPSRSLRDGVTELLRRLETRQIDLPEELLSQPLAVQRITDLPQPASGRVAADT